MTEDQIEVERVARAMAEHAGFSWDHCAQSQWCGDARVAIAAIDRPSINPSKMEDVRWAVNVLLEKIASKFENFETHDIWRSDAASIVRSFKHAAMGEQWRPISEAPTDGTQVDMWITAKWISGGGYGREPDCWFSAGKWWRHDELYGDDQNRYEVRNASHFMPRPAPPVTPPVAS